MMSESKPYIHESSVICEGAVIDDGVHIGPFCTVGSHVVLKRGVKLISHVCVDGYTSIGEDTEIFPFASIGLRPQDLKFKGEASTLTIGKNNQIREYVTMQPGTDGGGMVTKVGDNCLFMAQSHVAHDCIVGNQVIMANGATLAGHVIVEDQAFIGGLSAVHQFVRIGKGAIIGGMSGVEHDVIPFGNVKGERAFLNGLNVIGLKRRGATKDDVRVLYQVYKHLFSNKGTLSERLEYLIQNFGHMDYVKNMLDFAVLESSRSLLMPQDCDRD
jgi:UDP-N-acetylglucosamine acyltransferase